jgi:hypothetical protein
VITDVTFSTPSSPSSTFTVIVYTLLS